MRTTNTILLLLISALDLAAQSTGLLTGTVADPSGAVIPGARVLCRSLQTGYRATVETNSAGLFRLPDLAVGSYELNVSREGFGVLVRRGIELLTGQTLDLILTLPIGQTTQSIEVSAPAPLVQNTTSDVGTTVDSREMSDLPLNGRNAFDLALLAPGATDTDAGTIPNQGDNTGIAVNGLRSVDNNFQLDGASYTNRGLGTPPTLPNPDTLQEFTARTSNFDASSRGAGASVKLTTRSGTNRLHGTLFEFLRNDKMDARNFFSIKAERYKLNQYGGTLGGPIRKDRLFFFGSFQSTNQRGGPSPRSTTVPSALMRAGDYTQSGKTIVDPNTKVPFPGNVIPKSRFDSIASALLQYVPLPNSGPTKLIISPSANRDDYQWLAKLDYIPGSKDRLSGRYFRDHNTSQRDVDALPGFYPRNGFTNQTLFISDTHTFSTTWVMTASFNYLNTFRKERPSAPVTMQQLGAKVPFADRDTSIMGDKINVTLSGYTRIWGGMGANMEPAAREAQLDFSHAAHSHFVRFGFDFRRSTCNSANRVGNDAGGWSFNATRTSSSAIKGSGDSYASFLLGLPQTFNQNSFTPNYFVTTTFDGWVQDDWRIARRLTLNLGLRYDPWLPPSDTKGYLAGFLPGAQSAVAPLAPPGLVFGSDPRMSAGIIPNGWNTPAPRAGFAWDLAGNGKTVIRGSYGIFRLSSEFFGMVFQFANSVPFRATSISITNPPSTGYPYSGYGTVPFPFTPPPSLADYKFPANLTINALDPNAKPGYIQSWNFTVERQVARDTAVTLSYVGNHALHLLTRYSFNPAIYGPGAKTGNENSRRRFHGFGDMLLAGTAANNSNFHSLQAQLTKRTAHGLTVLANYSFGTAMGVDSAGANGMSNSEGPRNPLNFALDYARADYDIQHHLKVAALYNVPSLRSGIKALRGIANGWQVNAIVIARTGFPFSCRGGVDNSLSSVNNDTCDQIDPNSSRPAGADFMQSWFNTAAFKTNAIGTFGNTGRNTLRRPGFFNSNVSLFRYFRITEKLRVEARAEAFNALNHPNLDLFYRSTSYTASQDVTSPNFGHITHASDGRLVQLALKLRF